MVFLLIMGSTQIHTLDTKFVAKKFIGREEEQRLFTELYQARQSSIVVVYGRRRVGKSYLIKHAFKKARIYQFEGIEGLTPIDQRKEFLRLLAQYLDQPSLTKLHPQSWNEVFVELNKLILKKKCVLYFEELQWMACYDSELVSSIKYYWDNFWQHNPKLLIVLCGSAPSFMIHQVLRSKSLYNRSEIDMPLPPFSLAESRKFFGQKYTISELMDAVLAVGAIPPYLEKLRSKSSVYQSLIHACSTKNSYFVNEYEKIFISSLAKSPDYRKIIDALVRYPHLERKQIETMIKRKGGGSLSDLLEDLELCGFITSYTPVDKEINAKLKRYAIADPYVRLYHKFIKPKLKNIYAGAYKNHPELIIPIDQYRQHLAYSFERWLLSNSPLIAKMLGFARIEYACGPYFRRDTKGIQVDLVFERADKVITMIEVKYTDAPVGVKVIESFEKKAALFPTKGRRIEKVLISASGADNALERKGYFDVVLKLSDIFAEAR